MDVKNIKFKLKFQPQVVHAHLGLMQGNIRGSRARSLCSMSSEVDLGKQPELKSLYNMSQGYKTVEWSNFICL